MSQQVRGVPDPGLPPLVSSADFAGLPGLCHLAAAGETPMLASHAALFNEFMHDKALGMGGRERIYAKVSRTADSLAALLGCRPSELGFPQNVAQAVNMVARSIDVPGGNVVMPQWEYPSDMYPWRTGTAMEIRLVRSPDHLMDPQRFADAVDSSTRAIVTSLVSYYTGELIDLQEYRAIADSCGAVPIVDVSQALGVAGFDVSLADFAVACGYKWALGTHGAGIAYCNAARQPGWQPRESGWTSAVWVDADVRDTSVTPVRDGRRFELGNPAALCVQILGAGIDYLRASGLARIEAHVRALTDVLWTELDALGMRMLTPADPARRAGIVAFEVDDEGVWRRGLEAHGVLAWTGDKRVRISPHLYNGMADIRQAIEAVGAVRKTVR
ncbi:aminotransferase class V-fold PLP-dependent enzyme [Arthrobacter sp. UYCu712]|uniref:aminotransferase class V-fold PLP-dependent enzyme n=1 Tax=Arthrobacter sp. UYCu712 TaxID=3156340 RepID=UPI0033991561